MNAKQMAKALGWFSMGLGLTQILAPRQLCRVTGLNGQEGLMQAFGLREIVSGVGLLASGDSTKHLARWMWSRVAGDALDLALLGTAAATNNGWFDEQRRKRALTALGTVAPLAALDVACAQFLSAQAEEEAEHPAGEILELPVTGHEPPDFTRGSVFFVGTATVILRYAGFTILTDPNFLHAGDHVHLGYGLTSARRTEPALDIEDLPPIDFVVLSHYHGDHFDQIVEERLDKTLPILTTNHGALALRAKGFRAARGLETWETCIIAKGDARVRLTAMPGLHGPGPLKLMLPPVMGSMLEFESQAGEDVLRLYITGDTLMHDDLKEIPQRFPGIDLALLHLGGTRILGVMLTMDAKQGVEMIRLTNPKKAIPIHYNDYPVFKSPLEEFIRAVSDAGLSDRVVYLNHGDSYDFEVPGARRWATQTQRVAGS